MKIDGACHCRNIRVRLIWPDVADSMPARACGCGFCAPRNYHWTSHRQSELTVFVDDVEELSRYRFGTETADFLTCRRCGATPAAISTIGGHEYAVVNVNLLDRDARPRIDRASSDFSGEATTDRLARRSKNWISKVSIICP